VLLLLLLLLLLLFVLLMLLLPSLTVSFSLTFTITRSLFLSLISLSSFFVCCPLINLRRAATVCWWLCGCNMCGKCVWFTVYISQTHTEIECEPPKTTLTWNARHLSHCGQGVFDMLCVCECEYVCGWLF